MATRRKSKGRQRGMNSGEERHKAKGSSKGGRRRNAKRSRARASLERTQEATPSPRPTSVSELVAWPYSFCHPQPPHYVCWLWQRRRMDAPSGRTRAPGACNAMCDISPVSSRLRTPCCLRCIPCFPCHASYRGSGYDCGMLGPGAGAGSGAGAGACATAASRPGMLTSLGSLTLACLLTQRLPTHAYLRPYVCRRRPRHCCLWPQLPPRSAPTG